MRPTPENLRFLFGDKPLRDVLKTKILFAKLTPNSESEAVRILGVRRHLGSFQVKTLEGWAEPFEIFAIGDVKRNAK